MILYSSAFNIGLYNPITGIFCILLGCLYTHFSFFFFFLSQIIACVAFMQKSFCLTLKSADVSDAFLYYIDKFSHDPWLRSHF